MQFDELILARRSVRTYKPDQTISTADLNALVEAIRLAPSWKNSQTGRLYIAASAEKRAEVFNALPSFNQNSTRNACAYIVTTFVCGISGFGSSGPSNELGDKWGAYDLGLQNAYLILKASDLGYDTLIMGLRDSAALRAALDIPVEEDVVAVIAVGIREGEPLFKPRAEASALAKIL